MARHTSAMKIGGKIVNPTDERIEYHDMPNFFGDAGSQLGTTRMNDATYPLGAKGLGRDVYPFGLPCDEVRKA
jgi:hypothetical protein